MVFSGLCVLCVHCIVCREVLSLYAACKTGAEVIIAQNRWLEEQYAAAGPRGSVVGEHTEGGEGEREGEGEEDEDEDDDYGLPPLERNMNRVAVESSEESSEEEEEAEEEEDSGEEDGEEEEGSEEEDAEEEEGEREEAEAEEGCHRSSSKSQSMAQGKAHGMPSCTNTVKTSGSMSDRPGIGMGSVSKKK